MKSIVFQAVAFGILALNFLALGLRGVITKRPFVIPARWVSGVPLICFALMLSDFDKSLWPDFYGLFRDGWGFILLAFVVASQQTHDYIVFGVTDDPFLAALNSSLNKLNLSSLSKLNFPFAESLLKLPLPSLDAELIAFNRQGLGIAVVRLKPKQHRATLKRIAAEMNNYFAQTSLRTLRSTFVGCLIISMALIALGTMLIHTQLSLEARIEARNESVAR
jgi:hypothetical protein